MLRRIARLASAAIALLIVIIFLNNTNLLVTRPPGHPVLLAHRGVAQRFRTDNLTAETCTAARLLPSGHTFIENTIPSIQAAFDRGAAIVQINAASTADGRFAIFHDGTLDCRTDGTGSIHAHSLAELKTLDVGYGYTADGGKTFPLRGTGIGLMPSLDEVLAQFPERRFIIDIKGKDGGEGEKLAEILGALPPPQRSRLMVISTDETSIDGLKRRLPDLRVTSGRRIIGCLTRYIGYGWTGRIPEICRGTALLLPINIAPWLWGWPDRFLNRFESADTPVFVVGPYHRGGFAIGLNSPEELVRLPAAYSGGIWTDEITGVAAALGQPQAPDRQP